MIFQGFFTSPCKIEVENHLNVKENRFSESGRNLRSDPNEKGRKITYIGVDW